MFLIKYTKMKILYQLKKYKLLIKTRQYYIFNNIKYQAFSGQTVLIRLKRRNKRNKDNIFTEPMVFINLVYFHAL